MSPLFLAIHRSQSLLLEAMEKELETGSYCPRILEELSPVLGHLMRASAHAFNRDSVLLARSFDIDKALAAAWLPPEKNS